MFTSFTNDEGVIKCSALNSLIKAPTINPPGRVAIAVKPTNFM
jgi:hypothetical protein